MRHAALVVIACAAPVLAPAQSDAEWQRLVHQAKVALADAVGKGRAAAGQGTPYHAELELDKEALVWSIDLAQGDKTCNVVLDALTGAVRSKELEDGDHAAAVRDWPADLESAIAAALAKSPGKAIAAELVVKGGRRVVLVKVFDGGVRTLQIDGDGPARAVEASASVEHLAAFTNVFAVEPGELVARGSNPYFRLEPGRVLVLEGREHGQETRRTITVLDETRQVAGVETAVVEDRVEAGGQPLLVSRRCFAISRRTNSVFCFGADVDVYRDGVVSNHEGSWRCGERGARFGLYLPGLPLLGARFYQELAPGVAMDRAEIVSVTAVHETPLGRFERVLVLEESTPLEHGTARQYFAPGTGLLQDGNLRLVEVREPAADKPPPK